MPFFSQTTEYALRAMIELARQPDRAVLARELTESTRIPQFYLSKILHLLTRHRLLASVRGRGGGFRLAKPSNEIPLARVVELFEDLRSTSECILGRPRCSDQEACPMHAFWKEMRERYLLELESRTLADLAAHEEVWATKRPVLPPPPEAAPAARKTAVTKAASTPKQPRKRSSGL